MAFVFSLTILGGQPQAFADEVGYDDQLIVSTTSGDFQGFVDENGTLAWKGLPYSPTPVHLWAGCAGRPLVALYPGVGLMNHVSGMNWSSLNSRDDLRLVNEGAVAEQFIGQHLAYSENGMQSPEPVYWLREGSKTNAEVDFVVPSGRTYILWKSKLEGQEPCVRSISS